MKFCCIIFDFDGVIVENMQYVAFQVLISALKKQGINVSLDELFNNYLGMRGENILNSLQIKYNKEISKNILTEVREHYKTKLIKEAVLAKGLINLLNQVKCVYICSSNNLAYINEILISKKIKQYFPDKNIYSYDRVSEIKPSSKIYLTVIKENSLNKNQCCVIEDSVVGVLAAVRAGLYTFGYTGGFDENIKKKQAISLKDAGANQLIDDLNEVVN